MYKNIYTIHTCRFLDLLFCCCLVRGFCYGWVDDPLFYVVLRVSSHPNCPKSLGVARRGVCVWHNIPVGGASGGRRGVHEQPRVSDCKSIHPSSVHPSFFPLSNPKIFYCFLKKPRNLLFFLFVRGVCSASTSSSSIS